MYINVLTPSPTSVKALCVVLPTICIFTVSLRFWARMSPKSQLGADDWLLLPTLLLTIGIGASTFAGVALRALAYSIPENDPSRPVAAQKIQWIVQLMHTLALGFVKLSFVLFYRRVLSTGKSSIFRRAVVVMIWLIALWTISFFVAFLFACKGHFADWWTSLETLADNCVEFELLYYGFALSDVIMDMIIIIMPIPAVCQLHMVPKRKIGVIAVFTLGALAVMASILRLLAFYHLLYTASIDNDLQITQVVFWSMIETCLALIGVCLPSLYGILRKSSLQSALRSTRNIASLGSTWRRSNIPVAHIADQNHLTASNIQMVPGYPEQPGIKTYALKDLVNRPVPDVPNGKIAVQDTLEQRVGAV